MLTKNFNISSNETTKVYLNVEFREVVRIIKNKNIFIISDTNIFKIYRDFFGIDDDYFIIKPGEEAKNINTVLEILDKLEKKSIGRDYIIIGFGGGVVCDIAGFVASIYRRGISFGFIPTSLLAQIDASIGGKNGVNFKNLKNYIGTINQPEFIIIDPKLLSSLPDEEYISGIGELLKYSIISDGKLFDFLQNNYSKILLRDNDVLNYVIGDCIDIKMSYVFIDPNDKNIRQVLNLGHSFGHLYELNLNFKHGIAVVQGIYSAVDMAVYFNVCTEQTAFKIFDLFNKFGFKREFLLNSNFLEMLFKDKKAEKNFINFILPEDIGKVKIMKLSKDQIMNFYEHISHKK